MSHEHFGTDQIITVQERGAFCGLCNRGSRCLSALSKFVPDRLNTCASYKESKLEIFVHLVLKNINTVT